MVAMIVSILTHSLLLAPWIYTMVMTLLIIITITIITTITIIIIITT